MISAQCLYRTPRGVLRSTLFALGVSLTVCEARAVPEVVVSIAPVHALVAAVMDGIGVPILLVPAGMSPHSYALRPSQRRLMNSAQLLIWVGADLEPFLVKPIGELARSATVIELLAQRTVRRSQVRAAGVFARPTQAVQEQRSGALAERRASSEHDVLHSLDAPSGHGHEQGDAHVWLDPDNAIAIVELVAHALIEMDPSSAARYTDNARLMVERIRALDRQIDSLLAAVREVPYVVFHDAYQGFERHFNLHPVAALTVSPQKLPGTGRVLAIRRHLRDAGVQCVFSEPQYQTRLLDALTEGLDVRRGVLDPLGRKSPPGANGWLELMQQLAMSLHACLSAR